MKNLKMDIYTHIYSKRLLRCLAALLRISGKPHTRFWIGLCDPGSGYCKRLLVKGFPESSVGGREGGSTLPAGFPPPQGFHFNQRPRPRKHSDSRHGMTGLCRTENINKKWNSFHYSSTSYLKGAGSLRARRRAHPVGKVCPQKICNQSLFSSQLTWRSKTGRL